MNPRKARFSALALLAVLLFAADASAQGRGRRPAPKAPTFGSVARTKLLEQVGGKTAADVVQLGSVQRRALLTGRSVSIPRAPHRRGSRR